MNNLFGIRKQRKVSALKTQLADIKKQIETTKSMVFPPDLRRDKNKELRDLTFKKPGTGYNQSKLKYIIGKKLTRFVSSKVILKPIHFK